MPAQLRGTSGCLMSSDARADNVNTVSSAMQPDLVQRMIIESAGTKRILKNTVNLLLERGEKLSKLSEQSHVLWHYAQQIQQRTKLQSRFTIKMLVAIVTLFLCVLGAAVAFYGTEM